LQGHKLDATELIAACVSSACTRGLFDTKKLFAGQNKGAPAAA
jgi:hypothetical protein